MPAKIDLVQAQISLDLEDYARVKLSGLQAGLLFRGKNHYDLEAQATEGSLRTFCDACGVQVEDVKIIFDRYTGRSRGFGFVELAEGQDVDEAISLLNGKVMDGRPLRVDRANEPRQRSGGRDREGGW